MLLNRLLKQEGESAHRGIALQSEHESTSESPMPHRAQSWNCESCDCYDQAGGINWCYHLAADGQWTFTNLEYIWDCPARSPAQSMTGGIGKDESRTLVKNAGSHVQERLDMGFCTYSEVCI
jgi:hypothetical protein